MSPQVSARAMRVTWEITATSRARYAFKMSRNLEIKRSIKQCLHLLKRKKWLLPVICQAREITVNRISEYLLDPIGKHPGHMTLLWNSAHVTTNLGHTTIWWNSAYMTTIHSSTTVNHDHL